MRLQYSFLLLGVLAAAACQGQDKSPEVKTPDVGEVFTNIPLPPASRVVAKTGSEDAQQLVFLSDLPIASVAEYYRNSFTTGDWNLVSDQAGRDSTVTLYAELRGGGPMWVRIGRAETGVGSRVELSGAIVTRSDSAGGGQAAPKPVAPSAPRS